MPLMRETFSRRECLRIGACSFFGLSAGPLLARARATAPAKSCILIWLNGGLSHLDSFDLKPEAPVEIRGEFRPIPTTLEGVQICEHVPLQAKMWDKLAAVRSLVTVDEHSDTMVMTGFPDRTNRTANRPSVGSVISKVRGSGHGVPPFVSLRGMSRGSGICQSSRR